MANDILGREMAKVNLRNVPLSINRWIWYFEEGQSWLASLTIILELKPRYKHLHLHDGVLRFIEMTKYRPRSASIISQRRLSDNLLPVIRGFTFSQNLIKSIIDRMDKGSFSLISWRKPRPSSFSNSRTRQMIRLTDTLRESSFSSCHC